MDGAEPPAGAPRGQILEWTPRKLVATRLVLTAETWTTRIKLVDAEQRGTRVTMTVTLESDEGNRIVRRIQRSALGMVQETVDEAGWLMLTTSTRRPPR